MSDAVIISIVNSVFTLLGVIIVSFGAYWLKKMNEKQDVIKKEIDGHMTKLLQLTHLEGKVEGKAEGKVIGKAEAIIENATVTIKTVPLATTDKPVDVVIVEDKTKETKK